MRGAAGAFALLAWGAACQTEAAAPRLSSSTAEPPAPVSLTGQTMGSTWTVTIAVHDVVERERAHAQRAPIAAALERIEAEMSTYRPTSEVSLFNAHHATTPFPVTPETARVVAAALAVGRATDGAFDITIDPLIVLWGFDRGGSIAAPPDPAAIAAARGHVGLDRVQVQGDALVKSDPDVQINLGGIASGFAVDVVWRLLRDAGFADFIVDVTGELRSSGEREPGVPWHVGIRTPDPLQAGALAAVDLRDAALTTSGTTRNFFEHGGRQYSHVIDPRTGWPVDTSLVSVSVVAADALTADGYDTALLIIGEERARVVVARTPGLSAAFIRAAPDGTLTVAMTAGFPAPSGQESSKHSSAEGRGIPGPTGRE